MVDVPKPGPEMLKTFDPLVKALSAKAGPGVLLLSVTMVGMWGAGLWVTYDYLPEFFSLETIKAEGEFVLKGKADFVFFHYAAAIILFVFLFVLLGYLTIKIINISPTMVTLDMGYTARLSKTFGAKVVSDRGVSMISLEESVARKRVLSIVRSLAEYVREAILEGNPAGQPAGLKVRSNIFTSQDGTWLSIHDPFHYNFKSKAGEDPDKSIRILNGFYSTGSCFMYFRPILSVLKTPTSTQAAQLKNDWVHPISEKRLKEFNLSNELLQEQKTEIDKALAELTWIISMPVPYQIQPFRICAGVLNIDVHAELSSTVPMDTILKCCSFSAALIGAINMRSRVFGRIYYQSEVVDLPVLERETLSTMFGLDASDYDPALVPEPDERFLKRLSKISGLGFLKDISADEFRTFIENQYKI